MQNIMRKTAAAVLFCCAALAQAAPDQGGFYRAVSIDNAGGVRKMLQEGVNPNLPDDQRGDTALVIALRDDADKVFKVLLETPGIDLEARSANGNTALMMAAYKHKREAVDALLASGARVNQNGWTALHYAASAGDIPVMQAFLARGATVDACAPTNITPLMFAAREGQEEAVRLLLASGADPALKSSHGWTAAQFALAADKPGVAAIIDKFQQERSRRN